MNRELILAIKVKIGTALHSLPSHFCEGKAYKTRRRKRETCSAHLPSKVNLRSMTGTYRQPPVMKIAKLSLVFIFKEMSSPSARLGQFQSCLRHRWISFYYKHADVYPLFTWLKIIGWEIWVLIGYLTELDQIILSIGTVVIQFINDNV